MTKRIGRMNYLIRGEMKRHKITQAKAAYYIGITQAEFSHKLCGLSKWKLNEVVDLAELLGIGGEIGEILFK